MSLMAITSQAQTYHLDTNNDGSINLTDALIVINYILGKFDAQGDNTPLECPDDHHPHMIDLGLPSGTKWACCNVGATTPESYGGYYAWGETEEKDYYEWFTYYYFNSEEYEDMWDNNYLVYYDLGEDIGGTQYDVAHAKWGDHWQMPKYVQFEELEENCTSEKVQIGNVSGMLFTSKKNGSKLFLPAAGRKNWDEIEWGGEQCCYFSSTTGVPTGPWVYGYVKGDFDMLYEECDRFLGYSIRPVYGSSSKLYCPEDNHSHMSPVYNQAKTKTYHFDVNNDGEIELTDALIIINYILGKFVPEGEWYMVAKTSDSDMELIPVKEVGSLAAADDALDFSVVDTNGNVILENVLRADFKPQKDLDSTEVSLLANRQASIPAKAKGVKKAAQGQCTFVVADKKGSNNLIQGLTFQHDKKGSSWTGDGLSGSIRDLQYIARTRTELATASGEDVTRMLEELSGTGQADAEAVAVSLKNNPNVEEAYTKDGYNLVVKTKDDDASVFYPIYELKDPFLDDAMAESVARMMKKSHRGKSASNLGRVAFFNYFHGHSEYRIQNRLIDYLKVEFDLSGYKTTYYGAYSDDGSDLFSLKNLSYVIENSSAFKAVIIMTHGGLDSEGNSWLAIREEAAEGQMRYYDKQDGKYYRMISSKEEFIEAHGDCILYIGACSGAPENGYGKTLNDMEFFPEKNQSCVISWSGPNRFAQAHAALLFHYMLYYNKSLVNALNALPDEDPFYYKGVSKRRTSDYLGEKYLLSYTEAVVTSVAKGELLVNDKCELKGKDGVIRDGLYYKAKINTDDDIDVRVYLRSMQGDESIQLYEGIVTPRNNIIEIKHEIGNLPKGVYDIEVMMKGGKKKDYLTIGMNRSAPLFLTDKFKEMPATFIFSEEDYKTPSILGTDGQPVTEITIPAGTSRTYQLDAYPGHTFETPCLDKDVATVSLDGTTLTVTGVSEGSTVFGVFDRQNHQMAVVNVTVTKGGDMTSYLTCPDDHHPHMIDLCLPSGTKWACCNVDTDHPENQSPTNYGGYYAWGETVTKSTYDWSTYIHCDGSASTCHDLGSDIAGTQYDVAHVKWGGSWVMPSSYMRYELLNCCTSERTTLNGVNGFKFTGSNGGTIFLPAADDISRDHVPNLGVYGHYWTSTLYLNNSTSHQEAYAYYFTYTDAYLNEEYRYCGKSVRPVSTDVSPAEFTLPCSVEVTEGQTTKLEITSGSGKFVVSSSNTEIATVTLSDRTITITGKSANKAMVIVKDSSTGITKKILVTVNPAYHPCPDNHHPHLIDLGLPSGTKWACCNVGADKPESYGGYYAWGETEEKTTYYDNTYNYCQNSNYVDLGNDIAGTQYDVAHVKWGGSWVMPSHDQQTELRENCYSDWINVNGINGRVFTGPSGGSIFLPATGCRWGNSLIYDSFGFYWSSTQYPSDSHNAHNHSFNSEGYGDYFYRFAGQGVRPVSR